MTPGGSARAVVAACRRLVVVAVVVSVTVGVMVSGCSKETPSLLGTWTSAEQGETLDFRPDGTLFFTKSDGQVETLKWQADDRSLAINVRGGETETFDYSIDEGVLTLTRAGEGSAEYQRLSLEGE